MERKPIQQKFDSDNSALHHSSSGMVGQFDRSSLTNKLAGIPCMLPVGEVVFVLRSRCASTHKMHSFSGGVFRKIPVMEPMAMLWQPPSVIGILLSLTISSILLASALLQAATSLKSFRLWIFLPFVSSGSYVTSP